MANWHQLARPHWIVVVAAVLGGCASAATLEGMTVAPADARSEAASAELRDAISIRSVAGGEPTNPLWTSEVGNAEFRAALESSLRNYGLLAEGANGNYTLDATLVDLQQPVFGLDLEVTSTATYHLEAKDAQKQSFDDTVISSYTATPSESFFAGQRLHWPMKVQFERISKSSSAGSKPRTDQPMLSLILKSLNHFEHRRRLMTPRKIVRLTAVSVLLLAGAPMLSGCSVGMAVAGKETPNLAACRVGATQADIQAELGRPTSSRVLENGDSVCTYAYEVGNDPSAGRAVLHGGMDVLTFGLWELVGTPAEAMQGQKYEMTVTYDAEGKAKAIETRPVKSEP